MGGRLFRNAFKVFIIIFRLIEVDLETTFLFLSLLALLLTLLNISLSLTLRGGGVGGRVGGGSVFSIFILNASDSFLL